MSDSFFGFDTTLEGGDAMDDGIASEEDEEDYDALNDETFGDSVITGDWEQDHEKLAEIAELSRRSLIAENGDLSAKIAAFILDDEIQDEKLEPIKPKMRPPPGFCAPTPNHINDEIVLPNLRVNAMCTVEEIERNLIKPSSVRLEDLERRIILNNQDVLQLRSNQGSPGFIKPPHSHNLNNQLSKGSLLLPFQVAPPQIPNLSFVLPWNANPWNRLSSPMVRVPHPFDINRIISPSIQQQLHKQQQKRRSRSDDEYAGLMTLRERNWLASLQTMQISTSQPFQDDYYFMMYQSTHSGNHNRKLGSSLKNNREIPLLIKPTYTPLQFENSLGKLQVGSVMAPRKIIDTDIVENIDCASISPTSKKVKQILLEIEHMFSTVLQAEEAISPLANHNEETVNPIELFKKTVNILLKDDKLVAVLNIRKGKTLVLRILPHIEVSAPLVDKFITILPAVAKKDTDQSLLSALPPVRQYLSTCSLQSLVELSKSLTQDAMFLLQNKVGVDGDPESALITFSNHTEANIAIKSTEAVLNNRFIRVFWYNSTLNSNSGESKQENIPPATRPSVLERLGAPPSKVLNNIQLSAIQQQEEKVTLVNNSLSKTLYIPSAMKKEHTNMDIQTENKEQINTEVKKKLEEITAAKKKQEEARKAGIKLNADLRKRKQELLEKQLNQQKLLIQRTESPTLAPQQKAILIETIKTLQESIENIRKDLASSVKNNLNKSSKRNTIKEQLAQIKKTREEVQRELLDAELDLINRQHEGKNTDELKKKVADLKLRVINLGLFPKGPYRGRSSSTPHRISRGRGRSGIKHGTSVSFDHNVVDHRPTKLLVSGYEQDDKAEVIKHFEQYGEIVDYISDDATPSLVLNFKLRKDAEVALTKGRNFHDRLLSVTWATHNNNIRSNMVSKPATPIHRSVMVVEEEEELRTDLLGVDEEDEEFKYLPSPTYLFQDEESQYSAKSPTYIMQSKEEDEEDEDRSWRR